MLNLHSLNQHANIMLHTEYTRYQALEIIRENEFKVNRLDGETETISNQCADAMWNFYSRTSNAVIAGCLEDIYGERPVITD